jgi:hypothetical protein
MDVGWPWLPGSSPTALGTVPFDVRQGKPLQAQLDTGVNGEQDIEFMSLVTGYDSSRAACQVQEVAGL